MITNSLGEVVSRRDFMPFGEAVVPDGANRTTGLKYTFGDDIRQKFTGYQKDEETQLDFAEARMYQNMHGRFTAVDPLLASGKSANPQTFNRFTYVMNNPLSLTDPKGLQAAAPVEDIVVRIYTTIDKAGRDISEYFNRLLNNTRDERANQLLNGTSSQLDDINYQRARYRMDATSGNVEVDYPFKRLIGNKGPTIDSAIQQTTDSYDTAFKIGEAGITINNVFLLVPALGGTASVTTNEGIPIRFSSGSPFGGSLAESNVSPLPESYFNMDNAVDMNESTVYSSTNARGYPRNGNWFFKQLFARNPSQFSDENVYNIFGLKRAPIVDEEWIEYNPTHQSFAGNRLDHHHIDQENIAVPLPEQIHRAWSFAIHPFH